MSKVCFFTVTRAEDYDFLLGSIEHHAQMGSHLVLDTSPPEKAIRFRHLPDSVIWLHEPDYFDGWKRFRCRSAVERAAKLAKAFFSDVVVYTDSDEFWSADSPAKLFPWAEEAMVEVIQLHWREDLKSRAPRRPEEPDPPPVLKPYRYGHSEWHARLWPGNARVEVATNVAWANHVKYDGNPERHPVLVPPAGLPLIRVFGEFHHHVHYAFCKKDGNTAAECIDGWPNGGQEVGAVPWPDKLRLWKEKGIPPSDSFR